MTGDPHAPAEPQPQERRRWQFGFWTLVEITAGVAIAAALWAEFAAFGAVVAVYLAVLTAGAHVVVHGPDRKSGTMQFAGVAAFTVAIPCTCACLLPAVSRARIAARQAQCGNDMRQVVRALHDYHTEHGHFPPPYVAGPDGKPWHSWRALILPHVDPDSMLADEYDFSQPWDGPANARLAARGNPYLSCPSGADPPGVSHYYYVVGGDRWPMGNEKVTLAQVNAGDGTRKTILLVESHTVRANWLEPRDLSLDEALRGINEDLSRPGISSPHNEGEALNSRTGGANVAMFYGNVVFLPATVDQHELRALFTFNGGEAIDPEELRESGERSFAWWLLGIAVGFAGWVVYRHRPRSGVCP